MGMSQKQIDAIANATMRGNVWDGAVRSGKTFGWLMLMLSKISAYGGAGGIVVVGKNRDSIYRNVFEPIELVPEFAPFRPFVKYRQGAATANIFGKKVHVIGANDAGSESRIRGMTLGLAFCDELTVLHQQFFKQLLARLSIEGAQFFATTNPDSPSHWLKKEYLDRRDEIGWQYVHFTMDDNPSLSEEYKTALRREYTGLWYKRFILGLWVSAEGAVYDMFDEDEHVVAPADIPTMQRVIALGIDYGTTHPTVGTLLGIGADNRLYALDEFLPGRLTDANLSNALWEKRRAWEQQGWVPEWTFVDPAAASFSLQLYEDNHPNLAKANNDVLDGIRTVASLLDNGHLLISSRCTKLIEEIPGYRWDDTASNKGIDKPIKEIDDAVDSLRYSVFSTRHEWAPYIKNLGVSQ
ncbi:PBSX family phage terminase large subunit [Corynebacterium incognita]|uniref:PBSX family phage terminase large subunit n=1 Tax=Corynebacterium incognita TaxID=2754725 RepID=A0A7G7CRP9_9CORY|nr:PBSX family phage terminase large subunit [Corynebacterium incognita]QNE90265.1 PBSX family phage terminase large subunit [Corynebacterium incognita]